jgi:hypothetical protein
MTKTYNPATRKRCVNIYWRNGRRVRILHPEFGLQGKIGEIWSVGPERVMVHITLDKKPHRCVVCTYLPGDLSLMS